MKINTGIILSILCVSMHLSECFIMPGVPVRMGNELPRAENEYRATRCAKIKDSLEQLLAQQIAPDAVPHISCICSGGGYRALLYTTGALCALQDTQLMDALLYVVGLSGSTWAIATWISSGQPIRSFHDWLVKNLNFTSLEFAEDDITMIVRVLLSKYWAGQPIGFVDIYGACVANDLFDFFSNDKAHVYLSDQKKMFADGKFPMPIYTAINADSEADQNLWYEFTPFEVGSPWLGIYAPTRVFGRKFSQGLSITNDAEQPLSTLLGTFGLAVGVTFADMVKDENLEQKIPFSLVRTLVKKIVSEIGGDRLISAEYHNFTQGISNSCLRDNPLIKIVDAGLNCNIPYCPISGHRPERAADIIIILDASAGTVGGELKKVEQYAQVHNVKFPSIDYADIAQHAFTVFEDADPAVPIVIYIPRIVDEQLLARYQQDQAIAPLYTILHGFNVEQCIEKEACNTFNFHYPPEMARTVTALGECNVIFARDAIVDAIRKKVAQKG